MPVRLPGTDDRCEEVPRVVLVEGESGAGARHRVVVVDGVGKPARGPYDRNGAVPQRNQLSETTRLESRRHPQHVRAGVDALRERGVETDHRGNGARVLGGDAAEHVLVAAVTGADDDELQAESKDRG